LGECDLKIELAMSLPKICTELRLRADGKVAVVNSRDVAELFDKRHDHVLASIGRRLAKIRLPASGETWFRRVEYADSDGRVQPSYDLTRDGFTLLVMEWREERAMAFKIRYIEAFNAMEKALNEGVPVTGTELIQAVREIVAPLAVRFDGQDEAIERIEHRQDAMAEDISAIKFRLSKQRREITRATKAEHIDAVQLISGGHCPCGCGNLVIQNGAKSPFAEFDHHYENSKPDAAHTWLICKKTHHALTYGRVERREYDAAFRAYQEARLRLPGRQQNLF
jgi:Rha family phage regulatory protein